MRLREGLEALGGCVGPFGRVRGGQRHHHWTRRGQFRGGSQSLREIRPLFSIEKAVWKNRSLIKFNFGHKHTIYGEYFKINGSVLSQIEDMCQNFRL